MKIVVCVKQSADGEINPFDASAYETALGIDGAEITLLSMGPEKTAPFLESLTRLGAESAVLLCDRAFAGADTLATSYAISLAIKRLCPDFVFCGRQSVDGDTGQVGPSLAVRLGFPLVTNVMSLKNTENRLSYTDRSGNSGNISAPAVITLEKSRKLRLPSIRSRVKPVEIFSAGDINADISLCGLKGSPTRVLKTFENDSDRRSCTFISPEKTAEKIRSGHPDAVLWGSDIKSKALAPQVAALLNTGLCADCTSLETDGETLFMYRPACSGNIIAKIRYETKPPMATVRTAEEEQNKIIIGIGYGARERIAEIKKFAEKINAGIAATRKIVDSDYLPYELQVGLTGKTVNPDVYIAVGISGAVHHIAGIKQSGTVIAINTDKDAPIFKYADFGIVSYCEV